MIVFPAIDLKDGHCVRLRRGDINDARVFNPNPLGQAQLFADQGFEWLHIIDLDRAINHGGTNLAVIKEIASRVKIPVQVGGGIRTAQDVDELIAAGVERVIIGTMALRNPDFVRQLAKHYPGQIVVAVDSRKGYVAVEGWVETSQITALELAKLFEDSEVSALLYTDIASDGMLGGLNIKDTIELARQTTIPVIASGGVASINDLERLIKIASVTLHGVIIGRALYDGKISAKAIIELVKNSNA